MSAIVEFDKCYRFQLSTTRECESASLGTELASTVSGHFMTATDVNHVLGKLYTAVAQDRLPARSAATLAYIGQLLLNSVDGIKSEYKFCYRFDQWK